jgi:two-component system cell cycle sensor histidine kinase/response regulator CckA
VAGRYSFLEVSDNGCGMDEATQARLSEPYFTTKLTGHGLGLASVRRIVTAHGGAIRVHSRRGAGTSVRVLFPRSEQQATDFQVNDEVSPRVEWEPAGSVLLVDDDRSIRMLAEVMLESRGWSVLSAAGGEEAVELLRLHCGQISAVVLDMLMSGMDGAETLRKLRQIDAAVPAIVLSGSSQQQLKSHFGGDLPYAFLSKPFSIDDLVDVISAAIADARASRDRSDQHCRQIQPEPATSEYLML